MKKRLIIAFFGLFIGQMAFGQTPGQFTLLGSWDDDDLPIASPDNIRLYYSGCWGIAVNNREYAVVGGAEHVLFFDVTEPTTPQLVGKFQGTVNTVWREFKSYKNRIYAVSDASTEGLMIFDMSHAEDTIVRTYWSNEFFDKAHTITLDTTSGRIYLNGGSATKGIMVLDVSQNPDQPVFVTHATLQGELLHDSYVRNDTIYASSGYEGYYIYDMKDPFNPNILASINTGGYNHNSWLNSAGTYAYYTVEVPDGIPIQIIDLQLLPLGEIEVVGSFLDKFSVDFNMHTAIPHNVYIKDDILFNSQYEDGLLAYDISNPTQPVLLARYDTHPQNNQYNGYRGNWGNYPWLPSGNIIACDMQNGLFMLKFQVATTSTQSLENQLNIKVYPNPATDVLSLQYPDSETDHWTWQIVNLAGQRIRSGVSSGAPVDAISVAGLARGFYFVEIRGEQGKVGVSKLVIE